VMKEYLRLTANDPRQVEGMFLLGKYYEAVGDWEGAIAQLKGLIQDHPNTLEAQHSYVLLAKAHLSDQENPDPEEQGIAEIIIAKQRNGPTGTVKLAFIKEFTRFENLEESPVQHITEEKKEVETPAPEEEPFIMEDNQFNFDDSEDYDFDF